MEPHGGDGDPLASPLELPCGLRLENRLVKAAMSDSLGDGGGQPTYDQVELYRRWAQGGIALSIIGEVQVDPRYPEKPGNLVLGANRGRRLFEGLARAGAEAGSHLWPQLGHAGALAHGPVSRPVGPSALDVDGLVCAELSLTEIESLPRRYAQAALRARSDGFSGVEVHAGHGFLLSQFLSPLFNRRTDGYGGPIEARCRIIVDIVREIRAAVGPEFAIGVKINSSDQLDGGLTEDDSIVAIELLGDESIDLVDISGGTYFPGAPSSSDRRSSGPYFVDFARRARQVTKVPLMSTGGFKTRRDASEAVATGAADLVGLARALVVDPELPSRWLGSEPVDPAFPRFASPPPGGVTAWYTMRLTDIAGRQEDNVERSLADAVGEYEARDNGRVAGWISSFGPA
ncbi:MAG: NADH:flavin oxidoreductase/NADH oxidase family protein [Ilumatobacteraceae bacterium]